MVNQMVAFEDSSGWQEIERGTPVAIPGLTIQMEPGVLYEVQYIASDPISANLSWITAQINAAISSLFGVQTQYVRVEGNTIHHGFMIPESAAAELSQQGLVLPAIGGVIGLVMVALVVIGVLLIIILVFVPGGADIINKTLKAIPGMLVMVVGGVATGVLPGAAKIAGLVPLGVGGYLVFEAFVGPPSSPEPPNGNGGGGNGGEPDADITRIEVI